MEVGYRCLPVVVVVYDISLSLHEGWALLWLPRELEEVGWIQVEDGEQHVLVWDSDVLLEEAGLMRKEEAGLK